MSLWGGRGEVDIAVFACPSELESPEGSEDYLEPAIGGFSLGQDMYFLGFPYKLFGPMNKFFDRHPIAFIKKGTLSHFDPTAGELSLDAINNEGFSGGPVVFFGFLSKEMQVAGVVSKFRIEQESVRDKHGEPTGDTVAYNTGLLIGYGMKHVLAIVRGEARR